jgi:hypothetical protein
MGSVLHLFHRRAATPATPQPEEVSEAQKPAPVLSLRQGGIVPLDQSDGEGKSDGGPLPIDLRACLKSREPAAKAVDAVQIRASFR